LSLSVARPRRIETGRLKKGIADRHSPRKQPLRLHLPLRNALPHRLPARSATNLEVKKEVILSEKVKALKR